MTDDIECQILFTVIDDVEKHNSNIILLSIFSFS